MSNLPATALHDPGQVQLRPLEPADREQLVRLFHRLSPESVYRRFLSPLHEPSEVGLARLLDIDHLDREAVAAVAGGDVVGIARYFRAGGSTTADLAVLVEDAWQGRGISLLLIGRLGQLARSRGITRFSATILSENRPAISMVRRAFGTVDFTPDGPELSAVMEIPG